MNLLWATFWVLLALFVAALVAKVLRRAVRGGRQPSRAERPWR